MPEGPAPERSSRRRTYLMCPPDHFEVAYAINPWMHTDVPVDLARARSQWSALRDTFERLGHEVHELRPEDGLPDMVFAANGAFAVDGKVYGARFRHPQRSAEAAAHQAWYEAHDWPVFPATATNEGEGDFTYVPGRELILAGHGFRTDPTAHAEAQDVLGAPVLGLHLVDDRFYHLDVALFVLDDDTICYFPGAFSTGSQRVLAKMFPDAVVATEEDALAFGLNAVSDNRNVVLPVEATRLAAELETRGYVPVPVELDEFVKSGGSVKCCTAELRA